jgi:glycosyltransferase involved in cell wall biosynthesis
MKRLLFLAYFFPPLGGGGCQRTLKLVRYLDPNGWESTVVTTRDADYWILDPTLLEEVPRSAEIIRVGGLTSLRLLRLLSRGGVSIERRQRGRDPVAFRTLRRLQSWMLIPDGYLPWSRAAGRAAAKRIEAGGIDAVWSTSSPESSHLAGLALKRRFGIPWVADFRDPWVGRVTYRPPTSWHDARHRALERAVVGGADRVTVVSEAMLALYRNRYPELPAERFAYVPNGFDSDDWRRVGELAMPAEGSGSSARSRFVLLHAGQLAHRPTARTLLDAVGRMVAADPRSAADFTLRFLGGNEELSREDLERRGLAAVVQILPSKPHIASMAEMRRAQALILLGHGGEADSLLYTGKIYEYLTSGRPVLGLLDEGPAAALIRASGSGVVLRADDVQGTADALGRWLSEWRGAGTLKASPKAASAAAWERSAIAKAVAGVLDSLLESRRP